MFLNELKKITKQKWIWLLVFISLGCCIGISFYVKYDSVNEFNGKIYDYYMEREEGEYTDYKYQLFKDEYEEMQRIIEDETLYTARYFNHKIDEEEYSLFLDEYKSAVNRIETMKYIIERGDYLREQSLKGYKVYYFNELVAEDYLENIRIGFVLLFFIVFLAAFIIMEDRQCNIDILIKSSASGKGRLLLLRYLLFLLAGITVCVVAFLMEYYIKINFNNLKGIGYQVQSLRINMFHGAASIGQCIVIRAAVITAIVTIAGSVMFGIYAVTDRIILKKKK